MIVIPRKMGMACNRRRTMYLDIPLAFDSGAVFYPHNPAPSPQGTKGTECCRDMAHHARFKVKETYLAAGENQASRFHATETFLGSKFFKLPWAATGTIE